MYSTHSILKKSGGKRVIEAPFSELKRVQAFLKDELNKSPCVPGLCGAPGTSTVHAMKPHVSKPLVIAADISDFFPSVTVGHLKPIFSQLLSDDEFLSEIIRLVTREKRLPQGAPTSPALARLAVEPAFLEIRDLLKRADDRSEVTLGVDDFTISGPAGLKRLLPVIEKILKRHGFTVRLEKTKIMPRTGEQANLGLIVNNGLMLAPETIEAYTMCVNDSGYHSRKARGYRAYFSGIGRVLRTPVPEMN